MLFTRYALRLPPYDGDDAPARVIEDADRMLGEVGEKCTQAIRPPTKPPPIKIPSVEE